MSDPILLWNEVSLEANRVSHTNGKDEQAGPPLSARALAKLHLRKKQRVSIRPHRPVISPRDVSILFAALFFASGSPLRSQEPVVPTQPLPLGENTRSTYTRFLQLPNEPGDPATAPPAKTEAERKVAREAFKQFSARTLNKLDAQTPLRSPKRLEAANAIQGATGRDKRMSRLLNNQEARIPQPDAREYLANTPLLEEVALGDEAERDIAQVIFWNEVALNVTANDHTPLPPGSTLTTNPFEQVGPAKTSRALAIVHLAMFEASNAVHKKYKSFVGKDGKTIQEKVFAQTGFPITKPAAEFSERTAVAYAAYRTLLGVYPKKSGYLTPIFAANVASIEPQNPTNENRIIAGMAIGEAAAQAILTDRSLDGSEYSVEEPPVQFYSSIDPMKWKKDPLNADPNVALGARWSSVRPFVGTREELLALRPPLPPPIDPNSAVFKEVMAKGGSSDLASTTRTKEEEIIGKFWAYDATALLCAPPRLYNMIATSLALKEQKAHFGDGLEVARYLALINVAMADAGVGAWEAKYYYEHPRPVTAIRETATAGSPLRDWKPLGAPVSNAQAGRVNFTPPFPAYPSGHAVFGGALFETLRLFYGKDEIAFEFVSDEYNGKNRDPGAAQPRPEIKKKYDKFSDAETENGKSRIYLGIHWQYDADEGIKQGQNIAKNVFAKLFGLVK